MDDGEAFTEDQTTLALEAALAAIKAAKVEAGNRKETNNDPMAWALQNAAWGVMVAMGRTAESLAQAKAAYGLYLKAIAVEFNRTEEIRVGMEGRYWKGHSPDYIESAKAAFAAITTPKPINRSTIL